MQPTRQQEASAENHTQLPYHTHFDDVLAGYNTWSNDTDDTENNNMISNTSHWQDILNTWNKDTPEKNTTNRQMLDKVQA